MYNRSTTLHAWYFRDMQNACHGNHTTRLMPGTACGCRAICLTYLAQSRLSSTYTHRLSPLLTFSSSLFSANAQRLTPNAHPLVQRSCSCTRQKHSSRLVQHPHTSKTKLLISELFPRHAPTATARYAAMPYRTKWFIHILLYRGTHIQQQRWGTRVNMLLLGGKWRATVSIRKRSVAVERSVPLICGGRLQCTKPLSHMLHYGMDERLGHGRLTVACQGRRSETGRTYTPVPTLCTHKTFVAALPEFRNAPFVSFRHDLLKRNTFLCSPASWARNKYTATIKIQSCSLVLLSACVKLGDQPHTTKSLTGGVLNTSRLSFHARSYIASLKRGSYES